MRGDALVETDLAAELEATTLVVNDSPFDRWVRGEPGAMSAVEVSGRQEFVIASCADCHSGPLFSDFEVHVLGARVGETGELPDDGAGDFAFRTPTLRQLDFTAPCFQAGQRATLGSAVDFYNVWYATTRTPRGSA